MSARHGKMWGRDGIGCIQCRGGGSPYPGAGVIFLKIQAYAFLEVHRKDRVISNLVYYCKMKIRIIYTANTIHTER